MLLKVFVVVLLLALTFAGIRLYGAFRWEAGTRELREQLDSSHVSVQPQIIHFNEINELPAPVQRYIRKTLHDGQSMVAGVHMRHRGIFNMSGTTEQWKPFTSDQQVITQRPGGSTRAHRE